MACAYGSQRYNLNTPESDVDMFIVYAADTDALLGFNKPPETTQSRDKELCDYTVHEVHKFCEHILSGDPRCVETLFLHSSSVYCDSEEWKELLQFRDSLLTGEVVNKYLRDATGSKGTKYLDKLVSSGEALKEPMPPKICKLCYVILRLLQNARDIACSNSLQVFRSTESPEKEMLMTVRKGKVSYNDVRKQIDRYLTEIEDQRAQPSYTEVNRDKIKEKIEMWLLELRYKNFKQKMEGTAHVTQA